MDSASSLSTDRAGAFVNLTFADNGLSDWWYAFFGRAFPSAPATLPTRCRICRSDRPCTDKDGMHVCTACLSLGTKKPMASKLQTAGPQPNQILYFTATQRVLFADLILPALPGLGTVRPFQQANAFIRDLILNPVAEMPLLLTRLGRRYADVIHNARPTFSLRRLHIGGELPQTVDALAIRAWRLHAGAGVTTRDLALLARNRSVIAMGIRHSGYTRARAVLSTWCESALDRADRADRQALVPARSAWPIEPGTASWEWLRRTYAMEAAQ